MFFMNYDLEKMVSPKHALRRCRERLPVEEIVKDREETKKCLGREGYGYEAGVRALFLQFWGDYSDREMEEQLRYNIVYKWFCGFRMEDETPDHTYFCRVRRNVGEERISQMFERIVKDAELRKIVKKLESFVDASAIRRKEAQWAKRDEERELEESGAKEETNPQEEKTRPAANSAEGVAHFSGDKEARWGCKGKKKYWFGYKRHVSVDTGSGLIEQIAVTAANVNDSDGFRLVCPTDKKVLADKGYDTEWVRDIMARRHCEDGVLRKTNRKDYDKERNKALSKKRAPWEHVFSRMSRRTRYMGIARTYLQALMEGIVHNMKRLVILEAMNPPEMAVT